MPNVPSGYQPLMPYLMLSNAENFFPWMENVFGATEKMRELNADGTVMHCELVVAGQVIMYSAGSEQWGSQTGAFFIYVDDADNTYAQAISAGALSVMEMTDKEYGRSGGVTDPFGNTWWITSVK